MQLIRPAFRTHLTQAGDTIVEVLIATAVVSLILAGAYASANKNVATIQDTQEHSEALKLVQTQVEYLRSHAGLTGGNCYASDGLPTSTCTFNADGSPDTTGAQPAFVVTVLMGAYGCNASYGVRAEWDSLTGNKADVRICYRTTS